MNVLVLAPHPDDEAIGCGGSICLHLRRGDRVVVAFLTSGEIGLKHLPIEEACQIREAEANRAAKILGITSAVFLRLPDWYLESRMADAIAKVGSLIETEQPELVYAPHPQEWHPDHQAASKAACAAIQLCSGRRPALLQYEVWTPLGISDHMEDISEVIGTKLKAVRQYTSQLTHFRYDQAVRGLNRYRGAIGTRTKYAEAFSRGC